MHRASLCAFRWRPFIHVYIHKHLFIYTYIHTYAYIYIYVYIYICTHMYIYKYIILYIFRWMPMYVLPWGRAAARGGECGKCKCTVGVRGWTAPAQTQNHGGSKKNPVHILNLNHVQPAPSQSDRVHRVAHIPTCHETCAYHT